MAEAPSYWMNIDRPTHTCRLHAHGCIYELAKHGTANKGVAQLKRHGGWLGFASVADAQAYFTRELLPKGLLLHGCSRCLPEEAGP